jgi:hypothetical protein
MHLGELIERLEREDPDLVLTPGWHNPHSWRGSYSEVAFEPKPSATVAECLAAAREADGSTYTGWKGGEYQMGTWCDVYLAEQGRIGDAMSGLLLDLLIAAAKERTPA